MWHAGGRWFAMVLDAPVYVEVTGTSKRSCLEELRKAVGEDAVLTVEVVPPLAGVAERRVITYIDRGQFPEPVMSLASGRIWLREDVESYAQDWRARHPKAKAGT